MSIHPVLHQQHQQHQQLCPPLPHLTRMNGEYKRRGSWPTLGEAVSSNERVFVFVRSQFVSPSDHQLVRELQIDVKRPFYYPFYREGSAVILSTFKSG